MHPQTVMYAYAIPRGWDQDAISEAQVTVPPGLLQLMDRSMNQTYNGVTLNAAVSFDELLSGVWQCATSSTFERDFRT